MFKTFWLRLASHDHAAVVFVDWGRGDDEIDVFAKILLMEDHGGFADVAVLPDAFAVDEFGGLVPERRLAGFAVIETVADDAVFGWRKGRPYRGLCGTRHGWEDRRDGTEA